MPPKKMLGILYLQYGTWWSIGALAGFAIFIILGISLDVRFYFLALIWVFLFLPLVIAFLYFYYGLRPLTAFNSIPHSVTLSDKTLHIDFYDVRKPEKLASQDESEAEDDNLEGSKKKKKRKEIDGDPETEIEYVKDEGKRYDAGVDEFGEIKTGADYILLISGKKGFLWLPVSAFASPSDFQASLSLLNQFVSWKTKTK